MKHALQIVVLGILLGVLAGTAVYFFRTAPQRAMLCCKNPELAWLRHEFQMTDDQLARVQKLDERYQSECAETCRRISATNLLVRQEFVSHPTTTPEIRELLTKSAQLRAECQLHMLDYCEAVSREMPPAQGKRYLQWVSEKVLAMPATMTPAASSPHGN